MTTGEFVNFIQSIGFENKGMFYKYKKYKINLMPEYYDFKNVTDWYMLIELNDITRLENVFKKELRSIKLKHLLG